MEENEKKFCPECQKLRPVIYGLYDPDDENSPVIITCAVCKENFDFAIGKSTEYLNRITGNDR